MDEGKFVADFLSANLEKIYSFGKKVYGTADAAIQINLKTAYTEYLNNSRLKYSKSKSFFIRNQPAELYSYYVPTGISCEKKIIEKPNFRNCLEFTNRVVISGTGGSGKSVLIKHLFLDCIQTKTHVPILIELRDLNSYDKTLDDFIKETISSFGFKTTDEYIKSAQSAGHFCYFFDGFDEITPKLRKRVIKQISLISKKFPSCPIFLSSRPDDELGEIEDFSIFKICPLSLNEAIELVSKLPFDETIKNKFCNNLSQGLFDKHESFLSNPLLLSIMLLTYGENAEIPSKLSIFYNQAFDALFRRHDAYKGAYSRDRLTTLDSQDFSRIFSLFCLQTYDKRLFKMPRSVCYEYIEKSIKILDIQVNPDDYINDLLSAVCLMIEDGLEIAFSHRSFQEYFTALYISTAAPETQIKLIDRFWIDICSDDVMSLLREINPDLFERALLIPKLGEVFVELGVKRNFTITHFVRYLKLFFSEIGCMGDERGISYMYVSNNANLRISQNQLLKIAVREYSNYQFFSEQELNNFRDRMYESCFRNDENYRTSSLSIKSPLITSIDQYGAWHSSTYLTAAYGVYKKLKLKHLNTTQSFDILLGIK
nr:NACHT domain-containing protein [uncultured Methylotenera sp.]